MKRVLAFTLVILLCFMLFPATASADIGPKPSIRVQFEGLEGECYGTLLSETASTGPSSAWELSGARYPEGEYELWKSFADYEDEDGFYFLQEWWDCSDGKTLSWGYYPPSVFKILLYFPKSESFYVSPVYTQYAFDAYYTVDMSAASNGGIVAEKSYDYSWESISVLARIVLTLILELGIALLFSYREKRALRFIALVNVITQIGLNLLLNWINFRSGPMAFTFCYIWLELLVFAVEAVLYAVFIPKFSKEHEKKRRPVLYSFTANTASFGLGLLLAHIIPGIF